VGPRNLHLARIACLYYEPRTLNKSGLESSRKPDESNPERTINAIKRSPYAGNEQFTHGTTEWGQTREVPAN